MSPDDFSVAENLNSDEDTISECDSAAGGGITVDLGEVQDEVLKQSCWVLDQKVGLGTTTRWGHVFFCGFDEVAHVSCPNW